MAVVVEKRLETSMFEVAIYQDGRLMDSNGRAPEEAVADAASKTLTDLGISHRIVRGLDSPEIAGTNETKPPFGWPSAYRNFADWIITSAPYEAKDSNLFLNNVDEFGWGSNGGNVAVSPGNYIDAPFGQVPEEPLFSLRAFAVWEALHEIGHNMGFAHDHSPGRAWITPDNRWALSPTVGYRTMNQNICGEHSVPLSDQDVVYSLQYQPCVRDRLRISDRIPLTPWIVGTIGIRMAGFGAVGAVAYAATR